MKKIKIIFLIVLFLPLLSVGQEIEPPRTEITLKIGFGRTWLNMEELNKSLETQNFQTYTNAFKYKPASIEMNLRVHQNVFGLEFSSHDNLNSDKIVNGFQNNITFYNIKLNYARAFFIANQTYIFPKIGIGFAELHHAFQPHQPDGVDYAAITNNQRTSSHLVTNGFIADISLGMQQNLFFAKPKLQRSGINVGFNVGYTYEFSKSANKNGWVQHGQTIHGGPALDLTGAYIKVSFGPTYHHQ